MDIIYYTLFFNLFLYVLLLGLQVVYRVRSFGSTYALSTLDEVKAESICHVRARRAKDNQTEFLILFVALIISLNQVENSVESLAMPAILIMLARAFYVICVISGIPYLRSVSWLFGLLSLGYLAFEILT